MELRRTANAGILLRLDDKEILLDGVCREVKPYSATPQLELDRLMARWPDAVAFTHSHEDHFDPAYAESYHAATGRMCISTAQAEMLYPQALCSHREAEVGGVQLTAVPTRHLGRAGLDTEHCGFVVQGSRTLWFMGDGAPAQLKHYSPFAKPDVLVLPFAYLSTPAALRQVQEYLPCKVVLLHMPLPEYDDVGLWQAVAPALDALKDWIVVPEMGQTITL